MPRYQCTSCESILKRAEPLPEGKKIKCPKCQAVFTVKALPEDSPKPPPRPEPKPAPKPAPEEATFALATDKPKPKDDDDIGLVSLDAELPKSNDNQGKKFQPDDESMSIGLLSLEGETAPVKESPDKKKKIVDDDDDDNPNKKQNYGVITETKEDTPEVNFGSLRDKFAKSKIGPAMYLTVNCSNWLLRLGLFTCVVAVASAFYDVFPIIFCEVAPIRPFLRPQVTSLWVDLYIFALGALMCVGASRLHDLKSMAWSIIGSITAMLVYMPIGIYFGIKWHFQYGFYGIFPGAIMFTIAFTGIWCLITIFKPEVREGYAERKAQKF